MAATTKSCGHCGTPFVPTGYAQKYCTKDCWRKKCNEKRKEIRQKIWEETHKTKICEGCGYTFAPKAYQKYCSKSCRMKYYYEKNFFLKKKSLFKKLPQIYELYPRLFPNQRIHTRTVWYVEVSLKKAFYLYKSLIKDLNLPKNYRLKYEWLSLFYKIWNKTGTRQVLRDPKALTPVVMFLFFKAKGIPLKTSDMVLNAGISKSRFTEVLSFALTVCPAFEKRDRKVIVQNYIEKVKERFNLSDQFVDDACVLKNSLWRYIKHSSENLIAGVVCSLLAVALDFNEIQIKDICDCLGTTSGSVINKVRKRIFNGSGGETFQGLRRSPKLVKQLVFIVLGNPNHFSMEDFNENPFL